MILVLKKDTRQEEMDNLITWLESQNVRTHISNGEYKTVVGLVGDTSALDIDLISGLDIVESVTRITEPFKKANRKFHPDDSVIQIADGVAMGGGHFQFIAGPCSVEIRRTGNVRIAGCSVKRAAHTCCAAARSSRAPLPTPSRGCATRA